MQEDIHNNENLQPNSPELAQLIRDNLNYQNQQSIKRTLFKESLVKISIDKDFQNLFQVQPQLNNNTKNENKKFIQVSEELKSICCWLEDSDEFRGMAYLPFPATPKLLHIFHQKVQNTVIIVTQYHSYWMEEMEEMSRLSKLQWGFLNLNLKNEEKIKILQLYEMKKTKLFFISPSLLLHEEYHEFQCDLLVFTDLHLYQKSGQFIEKVVERCNPNRVLGLYSTPLSQAYPFKKFKMNQINLPDECKKTCICLKTTAEQKLKTMLVYLEKHEIRKGLVLVDNKHEANEITKLLKLKALTSYNLLEALNPQQFFSFRVGEVMKGPKNEEKVLAAIKKSQNYNITVSKYFDGLRFGEYDCVVFYSFTDVPKFMEYVPDLSHRLLMLVDDDYYVVRNNITSDHLTTTNLMKIVMKIMEKSKKIDSTVYKRYYSGYMEDRLLDCYSICKEYAERDEEKVIRFNWFCRSHEITSKVLNRVLDALDKSNVIRTICRVIYEIRVEDDSLTTFRKKFPEIPEINKKFNILNYSTEAKKPTRTILQELKEAGIQYKVVEEAVQLKVLENYEDVDWEILEKTVNENVWDAVKDLDKSFVFYKDCSYSSIELTRREKYLQRKNVLLNFYEAADLPTVTNIFSSFHKSNLLTSQIEEWLKNSDELLKDEHDLVLALQGVNNSRSIRFKQDAIFGRYRRVKYEDLLEVMTRIRKNKKVKTDE